MTKTDILCLGEGMVEFVKIQSENGEIVFRQGIGGDTSNVAITAARQGSSVGYISAVGADDFGDSLLSFWNAENINTTAVLRSEVNPTGIYFIDPQPEARRFTYYRKGSAASRMAPDQIDSNLIAQARILHFSGISLAISELARETCFKAIKIARQNDVLVSFDLNHRPQLWRGDLVRDTIETILPEVDIFFPSLDEAEALTGLKGPENVIAYYASLGASQQCLKMGHHGCRVSWSGKQFQQRAFTAHAVDSTGAGDSFAGSFLARYLETQNPKDSALYGCATAAITVAGHGAIAPLPNRRQVEDLIDKDGRDAGT